MRESQEFLGLNLLTDYRKSYGEKANMREVTFHVDADTRNYPFREYITAIYGILLYRYTGQSELVLACDADGSTPVRIAFHSDTTVADVLLQCQAIDELADGSTVQSAVYMNGLATGSYDLSLTVLGSDDCGMELALQYDADLFREDTIERMGVHLTNIAQAAVRESAVRVSEVRMISDEEERTIRGFNREPSGLNDWHPIHVLFEKQADLSPDEPAIVDGSLVLTYREVDQMANRWARLLRDCYGVGRETPVALLMGNDWEHVIAAFAVLKAGGVFMPVHAEWPDARIAACMQEAGAVAGLTCSAYQDKFHNLLNDVPTLEAFVCLDTETVFSNNSSELETKIDIESYSTERLDVPVSVDQLAYMIFTSGTTGKPKGVMIEHRSFANLMKGVLEDIGRPQPLRTVRVTNISFDVSVLEICYTLLNGGTLVEVPQDVYLNPSQFEQFLNENNITVLITAPAYLPTLNTERVHTVQLMFVGGSVAVPEWFEPWKEKLTIVNSYGPTEATVAASFWKCDPEAPFEKLRVLPIGRPLRNYEVFILDEHDQIQPIGVPGEMLIGGAGLARGYLNMPETTAEKFIPSPFRPGERLYRTGDLSRWLPDGNIECLGRIDHQVKIRGYRIEISEVEHGLRSLDSVAEAVVLDKQETDGQKVLSAYVVLKDSISLLEIRKQLAKTLPHYMIPDYFVQIESVPFTSNDKVDRKALLALKPNLASGNEYAAPENDVERKLSELWELVLGIENPSVEDDFFAIGGNSLKGARLSMQIAEAFRVTVPMSRLFACRSIRELALYISSSMEALEPPIPKAEPSLYYPVSSEQKRMYALSQRDPDGVQYNTPSAMRLTGALDVDKLRRSIDQQVARHESLRTTFAIADGEVVQNIHPSGMYEWEYEEADESELPRIAAAFVKPFDLENGPLMRVKLVRVAEEQWVLMLDMHHIVFDAMSMGAFVRGMEDSYAGRSSAELPIQYKDYAVWQKRRLSSESFKEQEAFWLAQYADGVPMLNLPTDHARPSRVSFEGDQVRMPLDRERYAQLQEAAKQAGTTLYMFLLAGFQILLAKYTGQEDLVVGTVASGRIHPDVQPVVGMFVNTLALRSQPQGGKTVSGYLADIRSEVSAALDHQAVPFDHLVNRLNIAGDGSRNPMFDVLFSLEDRNEMLLQFDGLRAEQYPLDTSVAKFDLALLVEDDRDQLCLRWEYRTSLFEAGTITRMSKHFLKILEAMTAAGDSRLSEIDMLTEEERHVIVNRFNATKFPKHAATSIVEAFEQQVGRTPDRTAVVCEGKRLTYAELNARANRLAERLISEGVKREQVVSILMTPSLEMIVGVLGILKSGGAFLPIDPQYPADRISYILQDSRSSFLVTQPGLADSVEYSGTVLLLKEAEDESVRAGNPNVEHAGHDLAYVIYTSGSTGNPKGVMIEHSSLMNLCQWHIHHYELTEEDRMSKLAGFGFDASVWEIFPPLACGASLHVLDDHIRKDMELLNAYFEDNGITVSFLPTQLCEQFMLLDNRSLRLMLTGGDKLKSFPKTRYAVANNYGPTEHTVVATSCYLDEPQGDIPIGKPIYNSKAYIVNRYDQLQPVGVEGELIIAGDSLARGYLYREDLTLEKFVDDLIHEGERVYRTGDLAKWLPDGNIRFLGRVDRQVKIRGNRIEIGEIEHHLLQHESIKEAVVMAREDDDGSAFLCAYLVTGGADLTTEDVTLHLGSRLPSYMVPARFVTMDALPLTANGKVNLAALPDPKKEQAERQPDQIVLPRNETESILVKVWQDVLSMEEISIHDHFFHIGGDSIKAIQISSRLQKFGLQVSVKDLLEHPQISELSQYVKKKQVVQQTNKRVSGDVKLTPIQKWFFGLPENTRAQFNQSYLLHAKTGFDEDIVRSAFRTLVQTHDGLRTVYRETAGGEIAATVQGAEVEAFELHAFLIDNTEAIRIAGEQLQASMNLEEGPLVKLGLFKSGAGDYLLIMIHHLVIDGVSWRILLQDFLTLYQQLSAGQPIELPDSTASFQEWADQLQQYADSAELHREADFWNSMTTGEIVPLPKDRTADSHPAGATRKLTCLFDGQQTSALLKQTNQAYNTEINEILLTALGLAVREWNGSRDVLFDLESHGRESVVEADTARTIGWFTSVYPVLLRLDSESDIGQSIKLVKETLRSIPNKGIGYGVLSHLSSPDVRSRLKPGAQPEIAFNYLGQFSEMHNELFEMSDLPKGEEVHPEFDHRYALLIEGMVAGERLELNVYYNSLQYEEPTVRQFADRFRAALLAVIDHCVNKGDTEVTPSDCSSDDMDFDTLEAVFDLFES